MNEEEWQSLLGQMREEEIEYKRLVYATQYANGVIFREEAEGLLDDEEKGRNQ